MLAPVAAAFDEAGRSPVRVAPPSAPAAAVEASAADRRKGGPDSVVVAAVAAAVDAVNGLTSPSPSPRPVATLLPASPAGRAEAAARAPDAAAPDAAAVRASSGCISPHVARVSTSIKESGGVPLAAPVLAPAVRHAPVVVDAASAVSAAKQVFLSNAATIAVEMGVAVRSPPAIRGVCVGGGLAPEDEADAMVVVPLGGGAATAAAPSAAGSAVDATTAGACGASAARGAAPPAGDGSRSSSQASVVVVQLQGETPRPTVAAGVAGASGDVPAMGPAAAPPVSATRHGDVPAFLAVDNPAIAVAATTMLVAARATAPIAASAASGISDEMPERQHGRPPVVPSTSSRTGEAQNLSAAAAIIPLASRTPPAPAPLPPICPPARRSKRLRATPARLVGAAAATSGQWASPRGPEHGEAGAPDSPSCATAASGVSPLAKGIVRGDTPGRRWTHALLPFSAGAPLLLSEQLPPPVAADTDSGVGAGGFASKRRRSGRVPQASSKIPIGGGGTVPGGDCHDDGVGGMRDGRTGGRVRAVRMMPDAVVMTFSDSTSSSPEASSSTPSSVSFDDGGSGNAGKRLRRSRQEAALAAAPVATLSSGDWDVGPLPAAGRAPSASASASVAAVVAASAAAAGPHALVAPRRASAWQAADCADRLSSADTTPTAVAAKAAAAALAAAATAEASSASVVDSAIAAAVAAAVSPRPPPPSPPMPPPATMDMLKDEIIVAGPPIVFDAAVLAVATKAAAGSAAAPILPLAGVKRGSGSGVMDLSPVVAVAAARGASPWAHGGLGHPLSERKPSPAPHPAASGDEVAASGSLGTEATASMRPPRKRRQPFVPSSADALSVPDGGGRAGTAAAPKELARRPLKRPRRRSAGAAHAPPSMTVASAAEAAQSSSPMAPAVGRTGGRWPRLGPLLVRRHGGKVATRSASAVRGDLLALVTIRKELRQVARHVAPTVTRAGAAGAAKGESVGKEGGWQEGEDKKEGGNEAMEVVPPPLVAVPPATDMPLCSSRVIASTAVLPDASAEPAAAPLAAPSAAPLAAVTAPAGATLPTWSPLSAPSVGPRNAAAVAVKGPHPSPHLLSTTGAGAAANWIANAPPAVSSGSMRPRPTLPATPATDDPPSAASAALAAAFRAVRAATGRVASPAAETSGDAAAAMVEAAAARGRGEIDAVASVLRSALAAVERLTGAVRVGERDTKPARAVRLAPSTGPPLDHVASTLDLPAATSVGHFAGPPPPPPASGSGAPSACYTSVVLRGRSAGRPVAPPPPLRAVGTNSSDVVAAHVLMQLSRPFNGAGTGPAQQGGVRAYADGARRGGEGTPLLGEKAPPVTAAPPVAAAAARVDTVCPPRVRATSAHQQGNADLVGISKVPSVVVDRGHPAPPAVATTEPLPAPGPPTLLGTAADMFPTSSASPLASGKHRLLTVGPLSVPSVITSASAPRAAGPATAMSAVVSAGRTLRRERAHLHSTLARAPAANLAVTGGDGDSRQPLRPAAAVVTALGAAQAAGATAAKRRRRSNALTADGAAEVVVLPASEENCWPVRERRGSVTSAEASPSPVVFAKSGMEAHDHRGGLPSPPQLPTEISSLLLASVATAAAPVCGGAAASSCRQQPAAAAALLSSPVTPHASQTALPKAATVKVLSANVAPSKVTPVDVVPTTRTLTHLVEATPATGLAAAVAAAAVAAESSPRAQPSCTTPLAPIPPFPPASPPMATAVWTSRLTTVATVPGFITAPGFVTTLVDDDRRPWSTAPADEPGVVAAALSDAVLHAHIPRGELPLAQLLAWAAAAAATAASTVRAGGKQTRGRGGKRRPRQAPPETLAKPPPPHLPLVHLAATAKKVGFAHLETTDVDVAGSSVSGGVVAVDMRSSPSVLSAEAAEPLSSVSDGDASAVVLDAAAPPLSTSTAASAAAKEALVAPKVAPMAPGDGSPVNLEGNMARVAPLSEADVVQRHVVASPHLAADTAAKTLAKPVPATALRAPEVVEPGSAEKVMAGTHGDDKADGLINAPAGVRASKQVLPPVMNSFTPPSPTAGEPDLLPFPADAKFDEGIGEAADGVLSDAPLMADGACGGDGETLTELHASLTTPRSPLPLLPPPQPNSDATATVGGNAMFTVCHAGDSGGVGDMDAVMVAADGHVNAGAGGDAGRKATAQISDGGLADLAGVGQLSPAGRPTDDTDGGASCSAKDVDDSAGHIDGDDVDDVSFFSVLATATAATDDCHDHLRRQSRPASLWRRAPFACDARQRHLARSRDVAGPAVSADCLALTSDDWDGATAAADGLAASLLDWRIAECTAVTLPVAASGGGARVAAARLSSVPLPAGRCQRPSPSSTGRQRFVLRGTGGRRPRHVTYRAVPPSARGAVGRDLGSEASAATQRQRRTLMTEDSDVDSSPGFESPTQEETAQGLARLPAPPRRAASRSTLGCGSAAVPTTATTPVSSWRHSGAGQRSDHDILPPFHVVGDAPEHDAPLRLRRRPSALLPAAATSPPLPRPVARPVTLAYEPDVYESAHHLDADGTGGETAETRLWQPALQITSSAPHWSQAVHFESQPTAAAPAALSQPCEGGGRKQQTSAAGPGKGRATSGALSGLPASGGMSRVGGLGRVQFAQPPTVALAPTYEARRTRADGRQSYLPAAAAPPSRFTDAYPAGGRAAAAGHDHVAGLEGSHVSLRHAYGRHEYGGDRPAAGGTSRSDSHHEVAHADNGYNGHGDASGAYDDRDRYHEQPYERGAWLAAVTVTGTAGQRPYRTPDPRPQPPIAMNASGRQSTFPPLPSSAGGHRPASPSSIGASRGRWPRTRGASDGSGGNWDLAAGGALAHGRDRGRGQRQGTGGSDYTGGRGGSSSAWGVRGRSFRGGFTSGDVSRGRDNVGARGGNAVGRYGGRGGRPQRGGGARGGVRTGGPEVSSGYHGGRGGHGSFG